TEDAAAPRQKPSAAAGPESGNLADIRHSFGEYDTPAAGLLPWTAARFKRSLPLGISRKCQEALMLGGYLRALAKANPDAPAILAQGRATLSYAGLFEQVTRTVDALNRAGYGRGDRIALALPSGPDTTVALLAALAGCVCVPLNPTSSVVEL